MLCKVRYCRFPNSHVTRGHRCGTCGEFGHGQVECEDNNKKKELWLKYGGDIMPLNKRCTIVSCTKPWSHANIAHHCSYCNHREHDRLNCPQLEIEWKVKCPVCREENIVNSKTQVIYGGTVSCCVCLENEANIFFSNCGHLCVCKDCCRRLDDSDYDNNVNNIETLEDRIKQEIEINPEVIMIAKDIFRDLTNKIYTVVDGGMGCSWYLRRDNLNHSISGFFMHSDSWGQYGPESDDRHLMNQFIAGYEFINNTSA